MNTIVIKKLDGFDGTPLMEVPVTDAFEHVQELMQSDKIVTSWVSSSCVTIPAGAYVEYNGAKYFLIDSYRPSHHGSGWKYEPVFHMVFFALSKSLCFHLPGFGALHECDWAVTGDIRTVLDAMEAAVWAAQSNLYSDIRCVVHAGISVASATVSFNCTDMVSAFNAVAEAFETEIWQTFDNEGVCIVHFGPAKYDAPGEPHIRCVVGENITAAERSDEDHYYNAFYVLGSTRNIVQGTSSASSSTSIEKHLTLNPEIYPYSVIDFATGDQPRFYRVLVFDDIYPSAKNIIIKNPRFATRYNTTADGEKIPIGVVDGVQVYDTFSEWYFQLVRVVDGVEVPFEFNNSTYNEQTNPDGMLIPGLDLSVHFDDGPLAGRDFKLQYFDHDILIQEGKYQTPFQIHEGDFRIITEWEGNFAIPAVVGLIPTEGDHAVLSNIHMPDEYVQDAQARLAEAALAEIRKNYIVPETGEAVDLSEYKFKADPTTFQYTERQIFPGRAITIVDGDTVVETRVTAVTSKIGKTGVMTITAGETIRKGALDELRDEAKSVSNNIDIVAAISKANAEFMVYFNAMRRDISDALAEMAKMWVSRQDIVNGSVVKSVQLNDRYAGVWANGFITAGGNPLDVQQSANALTQPNEGNGNADDGEEEVVGEGTE